eukprot:TRINITY_DN94042_c0_g1_i1.p1 TRINITY_DN94042_c0_g1~~TRINITY_DN94042_c0_g1_i1.p1  ORF type:complete len:277 (-),score=53.49 TRINITY_DN94042_c0_g1_i1:244-1074(-)
MSSSSDSEDAVSMSTSSDSSDSDLSSSSSSEDSSTDESDSSDSESSCNFKQVNFARGLEFRRLVTVVGKPRVRLPRDRRKMRLLKMFDPPKSRAGSRPGSAVMLTRAKKAVLKELKRQEQIGRLMKKPSRLEQAFLDASGENRLSFDYDRMKALVWHASFRNSCRTKFDTGDYAFNDNQQIVINGRLPLVEKQLRIVLMHECLHNTVERDGKPGNPNLSETIEHTAMALLGDRDEQIDYFEQRRMRCNSRLVLDRLKKTRLNSKFKKRRYLKKTGS